MELEEYKQKQKELFESYQSAKEDRYDRYTEFDYFKKLVELENNFILEHFDEYYERGLITQGDNGKVYDSDGQLLFTMKSKETLVEDSDRPFFDKVEWFVSANRVKTSHGFDESSWGQKEYVVEKILSRTALLDDKPAKQKPPPLSSPVDTLTLHKN